MEACRESRRTDSIDVTNCRNMIYEALIRDGCIETLKGHLSDILRISGWNKVVQRSCGEYFRKRNVPEGLESMKMSQILSDMTPFGKERIPPFVRESVKDLLRSMAKGYIKKHSSVAMKSLSIPTVEVKTFPRGHYESHNTSDQSITSPVLPERKRKTPQKRPHSPSLSDHSKPSQVKKSMTKSIQIKKDTIAEVNQDSLMQSQKRVTPVRVKRQNAEEHERALKEKQRQEAEYIRRTLEKQRLNRLVQERKRQTETEHAEEKKVTSLKRTKCSGESPSKFVNPSAPVAPRSGFVERVVMVRVVPMKPPPHLASTLVSAAAALAGRKSKRIILSSSDSEDGEEEELMDI